MTKSAVLYLPYLPNINWFSQFLQYETLYIEREERFIKSTFRNRCEIAAANGKQLLSIPIAGGRDHHQFYRGVKIDYREPWQKKHWQSLRSAYGSAPFFTHYAVSLERVYLKEIDSLFEFNFELLKAVFAMLKLELNVQFTVEFNTTYNGVDLRNESLQSGSFAPDSIYPRYYQVFSERNGFLPNLSIIDVIFNLGPHSREYLKQCGS